ncbi:MAG: hypothetical protein Q4D57_05060 [Clostridia bacterium]|nr:hypothetical protein [Clostridia bacterium]
MSAEYERISLKRDLGPNYNELKNVAIPDKVADTIEGKMSIYERDMKKYEHATVGGKLISTLSKISDKAKESDTYANEIKRREKLKDVVLPIYKYLCEAEKYFEGCKNSDTITKNNKKVKSTCQKLKKKGYLDVDAINEKEFKHFDASKYDFSFAKESITLPNNKTIQLSSTAKNYKAKCMEIFTNIRMAFSMLLTHINEFYKDKYKTIPHIPTGTINQFINSRNALNRTLPDYEKCVKIINDEISKHKIYFTKIENKNKLDEINRNVEETRNKLKTMVHQGKKINLDAEFIPITIGNDKQKYTGLIDMLESTNDNINELAKYMSEGSYENFEHIYKSIIGSFNDLPNLINDFKNATYSSQVDFSNILESYKKSIEKLTERINEIQSAMKKFTDDFKKAYGEFEKSLSKTSAKISIKTLLLVLSIVVPFARQLSEIFDTWTKEIENLRENSHLPTLKS